MPENYAPADAPEEMPSFLGGVPDLNDVVYCAPNDKTNAAEDAVRKYAASEITR